MAELTLTKDNFEAEVLKSDIPVLVDFWAPWCGPCRMAGPLISEIAQEYDGKIKVGKVNVDDEQELAEQYGVMSIPMVAGFKDGRMTNKIVGLRGKQEYISLVM
ncbi:MAG: thioredoxin [Lachnospiraceae bacterium]|nr:thioredoxin [Lachnospiraceae bacterium]MBR5766373.1 thioredoxin [Lachnospiraceae bacterium]MBR6469456.1 thioredoxin [Lachnospiraceae bacterium]MBR6486670.1 thioredoxin [Lachnospiraceae bacterium]